MKDYYIWLGEQIEKECPFFSWDMIMMIIRNTNISEIPKKWSIDTYLKEILI